VEAPSCLFAFDVGRGQSLATLLDTLLDREKSLGLAPIDRLDLVYVLQKGLIYGGAALHAISLKDEPLTPLTPQSPEPPQHCMALETENELLLFYTFLLDHMMGRGDVRPQLMSYLPPQHEMGRVVAAR
jgi:hypothetical protein